MADWPVTDELKQVLDIGEDPDNWTDKLDRDMAAAITKVKADVGIWDEGTDEPDEALASAALRAAVVMQTNVPDPQKAIDMDLIYQGHLKGHRRRFGFA